MKEAVHGITLMVLAILWVVYQAIGLIRSIKKEWKQGTNEANKVIPSNQYLNDSGQKSNAARDYHAECFDCPFQRIHHALCIIGDIVLIIGFSVVYR